jgi:serine phosphatase RsbU (regulator of sigma subunit)
LGNNASRVLVVDDEPNNLQLLRQVLSENYQLAFAPNGSKALEIVTKIKPDLILLDIMMPEMDGYEVCSRLKNDPLTCDIPVIFVTAKSKESDETRGFQMGAVDYITKPISPPIVKGRVKTHLELKHAREYLKRQNELLEQRVAERTREVIELQRVEFELRSEKEKVENELQLAAKIQKDILPSNFPAFPEHLEFDLYAMMIPAREVGGDFYDFFFVDNDHLTLIIADVADKGFSAALYMMNCRTVFRSIAKKQNSPSKVLTEANNLLCEGNDTGMFVTTIIAYYHLPSGRLTYSNGGHISPLLLEYEGPCKVLEKKQGPGLGIIPGTTYCEHVVTLKPKQTLVMYTDGVTEAKSPNNEFFGLDRLKHLISTICDQKLSDMCQQIYSRLENHQQNRQFDDITILALKREH